MTLTEAVQSGKPFRRPQWIGYLSLEQVENFCFSAQDLLARDYYLEERQVIITEVQFNEAWRSILALLREPNVSPDYIKSVLKRS
jgi:hypothetical protein